MRRDNGETYRQVGTRMAKESGIATPRAEGLARLDCKRKGKKLSNDDWKSAVDPDAKIARMKDGLDSDAKRNGLSEPDFHMFAKLGEEGLEGRLEPETFSWGRLAVMTMS